jgi:alpha-tubulin suppressor-like RCC1 family protein
MPRCTAVPFLVLMFVVGRGSAIPDSSAAAHKKSVQATAAVAALSFRQVSAGGGHTCGVTTDNQAYCWGDNTFGQIGDGTSSETEPRLTPVAISGGLSFRHVTAGGVHTCGLTTDNKAYCWGLNVDGQLGDGTATNRLTPVPVAGGLKFVQLSAGGQHTCALRKDLTPIGGTRYRTYCWGENSNGQLGNGTTTWRRSPTLVSGGLSFRQVSAGLEHTCALTAESNKAYCWGWGEAGGLGSGTTHALTPVAVATVLTFQQISTGDGHSCALVRNRTQSVFCWGANGGRLGDGTITNRMTPVRVLGTLKFLQISAGGTGTCGISPIVVPPSNRVFCWGVNPTGEVGDGTTSPRLTPVAVLGEQSFTQLDVGNNHSCGVTTAHLVYCWGGNRGRLGNGTMTDSPIPIHAVDPI